MAVERPLQLFKSVFTLNYNNLALHVLIANMIVIMCNLYPTIVNKYGPTERFASLEITCYLYIN